MKRVVFGLLVVGIVVGVFAGFKDAMAKSAVQVGVKYATGLEMEIDRMQVGLLNTRLGIEGLRLKNPPGFADPYMFDVPEVYVDYDLGSFLRKEPHIEEIRFNLNELTVVRASDGHLNLDALRAVQASKDKEAAPQQQVEPAKEPREQAAMKVRIDLLKLKVGKVVYKDYSRGDPPRVQEFAVNIDESVPNITNLQVFAATIVSRALARTAVARLTGFDLKELEGFAEQGLGLAAEQAKALVGTALTTANGAAKQLSDEVSQVTGVAEKTAESAAEASKEAVGVAGEALKQTTDSLKKLLPFGEK
jgi:uncharacterized protein involved in outer membrane biogenesis